MTEKEEQQLVYLLEKLQESDDYYLAIRPYEHSNVYSIHIEKRDPECDDEWIYLTVNHGDNGLKMYQGAEKEQL
jgi:hypothetical protein